VINHGQPQAGYSILIKIQNYNLANPRQAMPIKFASSLESDLAVFVELRHSLCGGTALFVE
jgi:hypothetical protein